MGLVKVQYAGLDEALAGDDFQRLCAEHQLRPSVAAHATRLILDEMRQRMAVNHEVFKTRLFPNDKLASRFGIQVNRYVGKPVAFLLPQQKTVDSRAFKLSATWNSKGNQTSIQRLWQHLNRVNDTVNPGTAESLEALMAWLSDQGYLSLETVGSEYEDGEGYQVNYDQLEFEIGRSFRRCSVCDRVAANEPDEHPCDRPTCSGTDETVERADRRGKPQRPDGRAGLCPAALCSRALSGGDRGGPRESRGRLHEPQSASPEPAGLLFGSAVW